MGVAGGERKLTWVGGQREPMAALLSRRLVPIPTGPKRRGGLGKPFPGENRCPAWATFPLAFCAYRLFRLFTEETQAKQRALCSSWPALTRGEFRGWQWGGCAHTPWQGDVHRQAAAARPGWETEGKNKKGILCFLLNESFSKRTPGNTFCLWGCWNPKLAPEDAGFPLQQRFCAASPRDALEMFLPRRHRSPSILLVLWLGSPKPQCIDCWSLEGKHNYILTLFLLSVVAQVGDLVDPSQCPSSDPEWLLLTS